MNAFVELHQPAQGDITNTTTRAEHVAPRTRHWVHWVYDDECADVGGKEKRVKETERRANGVPFKTALLSLVHDTLGMWGGLLPQDLKVHRMTAALSNVVLQVEAGRAVDADREPRRLLIKIHGYEDVALKELRWLRVLSTTPTCHAPALLAEFGNGHIEECIDATSLSAEQMRDMAVARSVMKAIINLHSMYAEIGGGENDLFKRLERWRLRAQASGVAGFDRLVEAECASQVVQACQAVKSPLVLSHNDLQMGNIMRDGHGKITFVDYEYSGVAPRAFDIANYFCEWMADYSDDPHSASMDGARFPSEGQQRDLCAAYMGCPSDSPLVDQLLVEVQPFLRFSHLFWTYWAVHQSTCSSIEFDYLGYAQTRASFL